MSVLKEIDRMVKSAQQFSHDGSTFTLPSGKTLSHVVRSWNALHPDRRITSDQIVNANGGLNPTKYRAGKSYRMPSSGTAGGSAVQQTQTNPSAPSIQAGWAPSAPSQTATQQQDQRGDYPGRRNNPGNMRFYPGINWHGEQSQGLQRGDYNVFDSPTNGLRAMVRQWMNTGRRNPPFTIENVANHYAPTNENNTARYIRNISRISGLGSDQVLDPDNDGQMVDLARGVTTAESGDAEWNWFTPQEQTNAVHRARVNIP